MCETPGLTANPFTARQPPAPRLRPADAAAIARDAFGIDGDAHELGSHQDQNFRIDAAGGPFLLKIANPGCPRNALDLANRAMHHASAALGPLAPVALRDPEGREIIEVDHRGQRYHARLLTYLSGVPLRHFGYLAAPVLRGVGRIAGQVAAALAGFDHPAADRVLQWDVQRVGDVVEAYGHCIRDHGHRALVERTHEAGIRRLEDVPGPLRRQVIHGDVTDWNLLAERDEAGRPHLCGLLDFGDVTRSWLAAECAVPAAAVAEHQPERSLQAAVEVVRGFHSVVPLLDTEVAALPALIAARAVLSAVGCEQQLTAGPGTPYVVESADGAWRRLAAVAAIPMPLAHMAFAEACGFPPTPPQVPRPQGALPLVDGLEHRAVEFVDLSVTTEALPFGGWRDAESVAAAVENGSGGAGAIPVGRYGEGRIITGGDPALDEPSTVHLGVDVFVPEGTIVFAPVPGRVVQAGGREVRIAIAWGLELRLAGVVPAAAAGDDVGRGTAVAVVGAPAEGGSLPAHVHVQLAREGLGELPCAAPASLAAAWMNLCPDPAPLLGLSPPRSREEGREQVLARRLRFLASPYALYYAADPPRIERGWKQWLYDSEGRPYLDVVNNIAAVGHGHPRVEAAVARQLRLLNTNSRFLYGALGRFAERLVELVPDPLDTVFLVNSGSEANDLALQLARQATGRRDVICFEGAYHGWTAVTNVLMTGDDETSAVHPAHQLPKPNLYNGPYRHDLPGAAERYAREAAAEVDGLVAQGRPPAAFLCEPLLGNSGGVPLPDGYLRRVYAAVRAAGGVCIADEVQVGYGRLGHHFWAFEQQGVVPDIVTIAKSTGNGYPVAAVITTRAIADEFRHRERSFFSSVAGSPAACEAGLAVLDVMEDEGLQHNATVTGDHLQSLLAPITAGHAIVGAAHGMGLYRGIELVRDGDPGRPATEEAAAICERMRELGVIVQPTGDFANVLKVKPPLCVTTSDMEFFAVALERTLAGGW